MNHELSSFSPYKALKFHDLDFDLSESLKVCRAHKKGETGQTKRTGTQRIHRSIDPPDDSRGRLRNQDNTTEG